ncbi:MAG: SDR family oxidoreductase [Actinobacteria bacterium]|nr:SDR family oxidoreductase [Actinomycetota bacterium]MBU1609940.1 SDR family oxidoreductase [Actinomycetota bacterium]MBU2315282.1 SDR family oxidoreductase [Actinomycetota bacterium]MBU2384591.1 SDR family oxidoreductase [Actinomycetota bacterium]
MTDTDARVVFLTGAAGGIGKVAATRFAKEGDRVVLADLELAAAERVKGEIEAEVPGADLLALAVDQSSLESLEAAAEAVRTWAGRIDVLALVAGTVQMEGASVLELSVEEWDRVHNTNLRGVFLASKVLVPLLPQNAGASVIAIASFWGRQAHPFYSAYCTSKAGVISFVQGLSSELADVGIRVNAVAPGNIDTGMHRKALTDEATERGITFEEMRDIEYAKIPLKTAGPPKAISDAVYFLSTDDASYMTGATMDVNGGVVFV